MGGIGRQNPCAFQVGGGTTELERTWMELRKAIGEDGAGPVGGIEDSWRFAKAAGIAKVTAMGRRALMQAFPDRATDHLEVYEENLGVPREDTDEGRRIAITAAYTATISAIIPAIREGLQELDSGIDVVMQDDDEAISFLPGKYLADRTLPFLYGAQDGSNFPTFSSFAILTVLWSGLSGSGGIPPSDVRSSVESYLNETLPSWIDWRILNSRGFYLDGYLDSRLDLTAFD